MEKNFILTLGFVRKHCEEVQGEWNGDKSGIEEDRAQTATDILEHVKAIEELLPEIL